MRAAIDAAEAEGEIGCEAILAAVAEDKDERRLADEVRASARGGEGAPAGFWTDARMANPISVARDHAGYAYFFEKEELKKQALQALKAPTPAPNGSDRAALLARMDRC